METQQPGNLSRLKIIIVEISDCHVATHIIEDFAKPQAFFRKPASEGPLTHAQSVGDQSRTRLGMGQQRGNRIFNDGAKGA